MKKTHNKLNKFRKLKVLFFAFLVLVLFFLCVFRAMIEQPTLNFRTRFGFAFGHIFNDLCASIWFSYGLLFYKLCFGQLGYLFVVFGQIIDAFATIILGLILDIRCKCIVNLFKHFGGTYTGYYIIGTIIAFISFPYEISELKLILDKNNELLLYLITFFAIFISQIGWTMTQLTHLSLINQLSSNSSDRIWLTSLRQAASIYSSLVVYILFWFTLAKTDEYHLTLNDINVFANNAFLITIFGLIHCCVFLLTIQEKSIPIKIIKTFPSKENDKNLQNTDLLITNIDDEQQPRPQDLQENLYYRPMDHYKKFDWFKDFVFYKIAFIYMCSRLYMCISMAYTPLYLQRTLYLEKTSIAFIPLIIYVSGMIMSFFSNYIENRFGNKIHMCLGIVLALFSSIWIIFGSCDDRSFLNWQIYLIAIQIGLSITIIKISSISLVAEMIGFNQNSTSFVYGLVSFFEKVAGSIVIAIVEQFDPDTIIIDTVVNNNNDGIIKKTTTNVKFNDDNNNNQNISNNHQHNKLICYDQHNGHPLIINFYYQYIMSYVNITIVLLILIGLLTIIRIDLRK
ncbi:major facilitator superfamily domain-containing protein 12-like [Dermatophagoides pteronyssinus]|uniref:major facilitator superfamily domain-containing protein 12-like n=1 Tax=Dermatophagoides pteronyssinus TaxID=6956 RepID=UPI003F67FE09